jgi:hypothetical protein
MTLQWEPVKDEHGNTAWQAESCFNMRWHIGLTSRQREERYCYKFVARLEDDKLKYYAAHHIELNTVPIREMIGDDGPWESLAYAQSLCEKIEEYMAERLEKLKPHKGHIGHPMVGCPRCPVFYSCEIDGYGTVINERRWQQDWMIGHGHVHYDWPGDACGRLEAWIGVGDSPQQATENAKQAWLKDHRVH